ncbi:MAG: MqnA/MqnD/SBP family protein [bacterium]|nr:ABC transporter substrate-binding protein [bacterium]MBU1918620.1 ABC transporter substrate-binding protein [bacterium]
MKKIIKIAHSPDSDDAFMFYALKHGKVFSEKFDFDIVREDIEALNHEAQAETYDITALSIHAYAYLADKYVLTASGASMAEDNYGPMVVAKKNIDVNELQDCLIAVPGELTTAFLVLKIFEPKIKHKIMPFEKIMDAVLDDEVDAGLIIHEGQLQYEALGLKKILSLIDVWKVFAGDLPLPLGGSAIKKSLGKETIKELSALQRKSIEYSISSPEEARDYAHQFKRDMSPLALTQYLSWYANKRTLDIGEEGKEAIELLFALAYEKGLLEKEVVLEII